MAISDLFNSIICCSCGLCCSKDTLCDNCTTATLRANGLPEGLASEIKGLSKTWTGNGGFQYSPLYMKIKELNKKQHAI